MYSECYMQNEKNLNLGEFESEILKAYQATVFQVKDSLGELVSFKVMNWQSYPVLKEKQFAIITAFNPMNEVKSKAENQMNNGLLEQQLKKMGHRYYATVGALDEHAEESFTVEEIALADAVTLGLKYGQYAILYCDKNGPYFVRC